MLMKKRSIIFIDDEPNILAGLRRMLRSLRNEYELFFADNAAKALDLMEQTKFDVVISDMRMPGMDGTNLLALVQKQYPHSIRIMLSGQADDESSLRTIGIAHQFLAKPCNPERLKDILKRASALHDLMADGKIKNVISSIGTLPSIPIIYRQLLRKIDDPGTSLEDIGAIINQDIAMIAKLLQLVNSAFFGLYQTVESPAQAVALLGLDTVKNLVLVSEIFIEMTTPEDASSMKALREHSMAVGTLSKMIAKSVTNQKEVLDNSYIAGVLHDIGKLVLIFKLEAEYKQALQIHQQENISLREAEKRIFDVTHCDVGAYLLGLWGFQNDVVEAVGFHHRLDDYPGDKFSPALAVHIANVVHNQFDRQGIIGAPLDFNLEYLKKLGMSDHLEKWKNISYSYMDSHK